MGANNLVDVLLGKRTGAPFLTGTELKMAEEEAAKEGEKLSAVLTKRGLVSPQTMALILDYCGIERSQAAEITAAEKEVVALVVKNLITAAKKEGSSEIFLVPMPGGTEVFFRNTMGNALYFFAILSTPSLAEIVVRLKETEGIEIKEVVAVRIKI